MCMSPPNLQQSPIQHVKTVATPDQSVKTMHVEKGDSDNSDEYTMSFIAAARDNQTDKPIFQVQINHTVLKLMADSGGQLIY